MTFDALPKIHVSRDFYCYHVDAQRSRAVDTDKSDCLFTWRIKNPLIDLLESQSDRDKHELLRAARVEFAEFYRTASPYDTILLDGLVMTRAALAVGFMTPRTGLTGPLRGALERVSAKTEQVFTDFRENVRTSATFSALSPAEQQRLQHTLFDIPPHWLR